MSVLFLHGWITTALGEECEPSSFSHSSSSSSSSFSFVLQFRRDDPFVFRNDGQLHRRSFHSSKGSQTYRKKVSLCKKVTNVGRLLSFFPKSSIYVKDIPFFYNYMFDHTYISPTFSTSDTRSALQIIYCSKCQSQLIHFCFLQRFHTT